MGKNEEKKDEAPGQNKEFSIVVNGKPKTFTGREITFDQVVILAFGTVSTNPNVSYSITYIRGEGNKPEGTLDRGRSVKLKEDMEFAVRQTDKS
mgnify:FL=1